MIFGFVFLLTGVREDTDDDDINLENLENSCGNLEKACGNLENQNPRFPIITKNKKIHVGTTNRNPDLSKRGSKCLILGQNNPKSKVENNDKKVDKIDDFENAIEAVEIKPHSMNTAEIIKVLEDNSESEKTKSFSKRNPNSEFENYNDDDLEMLQIKEETDYSENGTINCEHFWFRKWPFK